MAKLALLISLIALVVAIAAYQEAGGSKKDLAKRIESVRQDAANGLSRMEKLLRPSQGGADAPSKP